MFSFSPGAAGRLAQKQGSLNLSARARSGPVLALPSRPEDEDEDEDEAPHEDGDEYVQEDDDGCVFALCSIKIDSAVLS